jgi:two-component system sensor histidine kinase/response regulator
VGMTDLALETPLNPEQREYLEAIKSSADALLKVINDILDFSKIEARKLDLESIEFRLHEALQGAVDALAFQAQKKGLKVSLETSLDIPDNLHMRFLPPYSPELNPVEHLWEEIREKSFGRPVGRPAGLRD